MRMQLNRRRLPRFVLSPMYHEVTVRRVGDADAPADTGHAYDVGEGGIQFELDNAYEIGDHLEVRIHLPPAFDSTGDGCIVAIGRVVWVGDLEDPGPVRMAVAFGQFPRQGDHQRLMTYVGATHLRRAA